MILAPEDTQFHIISKLVDIAARDKKRANPVIKFIKQDFLYQLKNNFQGNRLKTPIMIAITGESASGKSTFVRALTAQIRQVEQAKNRNLLNFVSADNYFNDISDKIEEHGSFDSFLANENYNPDAPSSFQLGLMKSHLERLEYNEDVWIPEYKVNGSGVSMPDAIFIKSSPVIISEGIAVLYPEIRDVFHIKFYVEVNEKTRLERYLSRAVNNRNQTEKDALEQYKVVNESAIEHLIPRRKYADVIINGAADISDFSAIAKEICDII
ncbi:MAG: hypothetical protein PHX18_07330 [Candidatus Gastranaerophilales bacterium]|nr:hypothetical protein [Candidatus Gastranaerophilales bacterium]